MMSPPAAPDGWWKQSIVKLQWIINYNLLVITSSRRRMITRKQTNKRKGTAAITVLTNTSIIGEVSGMDYSDSRQVQVQS